jgi:membrane protease YdiL (CAAX protease family)
MKDFATNHPLLFVLITIPAWILAGFAMMVLASAGTGRGIGNSTIQSIGTLFATLLLVLVTWRLGWLKPSGFTCLGGWQVWLLSLVIMVYTCIIYYLSFFGSLEPDPGLVRTSAGQGIFLRQVVVGFVEEALFRGLLLYALIRVWGATRRGVFASVVATAILFGSMHILQLASGNTLPSTLMVIVGATFSGIWMAAIVLRWGTIWPVVLIHAGGNMVVNIGALAFGHYAPQTIDFVQAALLEIPLVFWGLWLLWRLPLREGTLASRESRAASQSSAPDPVHLL